LQWLGSSTSDSGKSKQFRGGGDEDERDLVTLDSCTEPYPSSSQSHRQRGKKSTGGKGPRGIMSTHHTNPGPIAMLSTSTPPNSSMTGADTSRNELFYDMEMRDTKLKILNRYTDVTMIGAGAQGLVM